MKATYPPCGRGIRHWFAGEEECSHCGLPKPSREITATEAQPGDYALLKVGWGSDWVKVVGVYPLRYRRHGHDGTASMSSAVAWRTVRP